MRKAIRAVLCGLACFLGRARVGAGPLRVWMEPSTECGGGCGFCPVGLGLVPAAGPMSAETFLRAASGLPKGCEVNLHHRGEPLTHPDAPAMAGALAAAGHSVRININGMRLDPETRARLLESGASIISLSFDGPQKVRYSKLRPGCDYEKVVANFKAMLAERRGRRPRLAVETIAFPDLPGDPRGTAALIRAVFEPFRPDAVVLRPPHSWDGSISAATLAPAQGGMCAAASAGKDPAGSDSSGSAPSGYASGGAASGRLGSCALDSRGPATSVPGASARPRRRCHHPWTTLVVFADGTVTVCPQDYSGKLAVGNAADESLADIWNGRRMRELRAAHASGRAYDMEPCRTCPVPFENGSARLAGRLAGWFFSGGRLGRRIPPMSPKKAARFDAIRGSLPPLGRWLDAAVGAGVIALALRDGRRWTYVEADPAARASASALLGKEVLPEERMEDIPAESFDGVLLSDRLEHVEDDAGLLRRCARLLAPGGCLVITVPVAGRFLYRLRRALGTDDAALGHVREGYAPGELAALMESAGLRLEATRFFAGPISEIADAMMVAAARTFGIRTRPCREGAAASDQGAITLFGITKNFPHIARFLFALIRFFDRTLERRWGHGLLVVAKKP